MSLILTGSISLDSTFNQSLSQKVTKKGEKYVWATFLWFASMCLQSINMIWAYTYKLLVGPEHMLKKLNAYSVYACTLLSSSLPLDSPAPSES